MPRNAPRCKRILQWHYSEVILHHTGQSFTLESHNDGVHSVCRTAGVDQRPPFTTPLGLNSRTASWVGGAPTQLQLILQPKKCLCFIVVGFFFVGAVGGGCGADKVHALSDQ